MGAGAARLTPQGLHPLLIECVIFAERERAILLTSMLRQFRSLRTPVAIQGALKRNGDVLKASSGVVRICVANAVCVMHCLLLALNLGTGFKRPFPIVRLT
ncbi:hypothetical protein [Stenotrophobium rhamnosiphilum]|uniref:hypothetical protein n=1 Tax=Stenotrophobium rhamnosiphilum TaxID=2029166 RepID=UPI0011B2417D|nr:hypothetical protein [Stenotrophobium rhamnosiphilum]